jgi:hypothetical protein
MKLIKDQLLKPELDRIVGVIIYTVGCLAVGLSCLIFRPVIDNNRYIGDILLFCVMIGLGLFIGSFMIKSVKGSNGGLVAIRFSLLIVLIGTLGCVCKIIDRTIYRPITDLSIGGTARLSRLDGGNIFSMVAAVALPFSAVYFMLYDRYKNVLYKCASRLPALLLLIDFTLTASRGLIIICAFLFLRPRTFRQFVVVLFSCLSLASLIYNIRSVNSGVADSGDRLSISDTSSFMQNIQITTLGDQVSAIFPEPVSETILHLSAYLSHSVAESVFVFENEPQLAFRPHLVLSQLTPILGRLNFEMTEPIRPGLYYGMHGSSFLAFGYLGVIHAFFVGAWLSSILRISWLVGHYQFSILFAVCIAGLAFVDMVSGYDMVFYQSSYIITVVLFGGKVIFR